MLGCGPNQAVTPSKKSKESFTAMEVGAILEDLRSQFRTFGEQLQATNRHLDVIEAEVARQAERLTMVELRLTSIESRLTDVESRLTDVESRITDVESRLTQVESRLHEVESRLTNIESHVTHLEAQGVDVEGTLKEITDWMRRTDLDRRVTTLEQKVNLS